MCKYLEESLMYECNYCGDPLCPEICGKGKQTTQEWVDSEEYQKLLEDNPLDFVL